MEPNVSNVFADQLEATEANSNGNSHSFDEVAQATIDATPEEMLKDAEAAVKNDKVNEAIVQARVEKNEAKDEDLSSRDQKNASEKDNKQAAKEINDEVTDDLIEDIKTMVARRGDKEYEIAEDAVLTVKIDGEEVEVPIAELRNNYSGKVAWDKKFTELSKEKQGFVEEKTLVERYINEFAELASDPNDKTKALEYLAQLSGQDPLAFRRQLRNQMFEEFNKFSQMSDAEIKAYELNEENEFLRRQQESVNNRYSEQQTQVELRAKVDSLRETYGVTQEELLNHYDAIVQERTSQGMNPEPTIEDLENALIDQRVAGSAEYLLGKVDSELVSEEHVAAVKELIVRNQDWTEEDFIDVIKEGFGINAKPAKKASKKVVEAAKKQEESKEELSDLAKKTSALASFDDLDDLY